MPRILKNQTHWEGLYYYRKSVVLYQMTVAFCRRFLPARGDRTVDQMVQAARSGKQNILEGLADGVASTEMELKLLNVARASLKELREDFFVYFSQKNAIGNGRLVTLSMRRLSPLRLPVRLHISG